MRDHVHVILAGTIASATNLNRQTLVLDEFCYHTVRDGVRQLGS